MAGFSSDIDFSEEDTIAIVMDSGDEVRFELLEGEHSVYITDVSSSAIKFRVAPFLGGDSVTFPAYVSLDTISKIDLNKDGSDDLNIALYSVDEDERATVVFQLIEENEVTGNVGVVEEVKNFKSIWLTIIGISVVILIVVLVFRSMGGEEERVEEKKEIKEEIVEKKEESEEKKEEEE